MGKKRRLIEEKAASDEEVRRLLSNPKIRKALNEEISRFMREQFKYVVKDNLAAVLWTMRTVFGFGEKRLKRWLDSYDKIVDELLKKYEMYDTSKDIDFLARYELEKVGIIVDDLVKDKDLL